MLDVYRYILSSTAHYVLLYYCFCLQSDKPVWSIIECLERNEIPLPLVFQHSACDVTVRLSWVFKLCLREMFCIAWLFFNECTWLNKVKWKACFLECHGLSCNVENPKFNNVFILVGWTLLHQKSRYFWSQLPFHDEIRITKKVNILKALLRLTLNHFCFKCKVSKND